MYAYMSFVYNFILYYSVFSLTLESPVACGAIVDVAVIVFEFWTTGGWLRRAWKAEIAQLRRNARTIYMNIISTYKSRVMRSVLTYTMFCFSKPIRIYQTFCHVFGRRRSRFKALGLHLSLSQINTNAFLASMRGRRDT